MDQASLQQVREVKASLDASTTERTRLISQAASLSDQLAQAQDKLDKLTYRYNLLWELWSTGGATKVQELAVQVESLTAEKNKLLKRLEDQKDRLAQAEPAHQETLEVVKNLMEEAGRVARHPIAPPPPQVPTQQLAIERDRLLRTVADRDLQLIQLTAKHVETLGVVRDLMEKAGAVSKLPALTTPAPVPITYQLRASFNINTLVGATTSEPPDQRMMNVYTLLKRLLGSLIGTSKLPMSLGASGDRTITVVQGSNEDIALAAFPSLLKRIS